MRLCIAAIVAFSSSMAFAAPQRIVIVRHGEKPDDGDHLSCQGHNRALALPKVLAGKFGKPDAIYVPALGLGARTAHARMFQTATPLALKYNLAINTKFDESDAAGVAADVMGRSGTVVLVWEHSMIADVASRLGIAAPPKWKKHDFDSIWVISFDRGAPALTIDREGLAPSVECAF